MLKPAWQEHALDIFVMLVLLQRTGKDWSEVNARSSRLKNRNFTSPFQAQPTPEPLDASSLGLFSEVAPHSTSELVPGH
jgi:hypothetical protein